MFKQAYCPGFSDALNVIRETEKSRERYRKLVERGDKWLVSTDIKYAKLEEGLQ